MFLKNLHVLLRIALESLSGCIPDQIDLNFLPPGAFWCLWASPGHPWGSLGASLAPSGLCFSSPGTLFSRKFVSVLNKLNYQGQVVVQGIQEPLPTEEKQLAQKG